jgi:formamidopyrimidine-DNA glycosylase
VPELPDLEYVVPNLRSQLVGSRIDEVRTRQPVVWRVAVPGTPDDALKGRRFSSVERRGHFVIFMLDPDRWLVTSLMLAGRFRLASVGEKDEGSLCAAFRIGDRELRYLDDLKMGKLYVVPAGQTDRVPGLDDLGVDPISPDFTRERFRAMAAKRRDQVRVFLMDKSAIASIGNAYADEILFAARIHPKTFVRSLSPELLDQLYDSTKRVLDEACAEVLRRGAPIDEKVRDFLKVRNRKGEACPQCGTKIRTTGVRGVDAFFCPQCQPATRSQFVDFRNLENTSPVGREAFEVAPAPPASGSRRRGGSRR